MTARVSVMWMCLAAAMVSTPRAGWAQGQAIDGIIEGVVRAQQTRRGGGRRQRARLQRRHRLRAIGRERHRRPLRHSAAAARRVRRVRRGADVRVDEPDRRGAARRRDADRGVLAVGRRLLGSGAGDRGASRPSKSGRTVQSNTYEERTVRAIPTVGRSILDFFVLQPGVNAPPISSGGSGTGTPSTVYGGLGLRQMNVDGVSNNLQGGARNLVISQEAVQEFQTVTNFSAEFGRVAGGIQNAITRSGSNLPARLRVPVHASEGAGGTAVPARARTRPSPTSRATTTAARPAARWCSGKSFFFVSYERWSQDLPVIVTITPQNAATLGIPASSIGAYTSTFRAHTLTARNDTQLSQNHRLSFRYNYYHDRESPLNGGLQSLEVSTRFDENPYSFTTQLVSVLRPNLVNEARFLYADRSIENGVSADPDAPNINISGIGSFNGNSNGTRRTREWGVHIVDNLTWTTGRHTMKFGIDLLPVTFRERTTNINGSFVFGGLTAVAGVRGAVTPLDQFLLTEAARDRSGDRAAVLLLALHAVDRRRVLRGVDVQSGLLRPGRFPRSAIA